MQLESILNLDEFRLPAINAGSDPFVVFVKEKLAKYVNAIKSSHGDLFDGCPPQLGSFTEFSADIEKFSDDLIEVIRLQRSSKLVEAYGKFEEAMQGVGIAAQNHKGAIFFVKTGYTFYRCTFEDGKADIFPVPRFFHAPFEIDEVVGSTRFTFPGRPSIYLTNSIVGGYVEVRATSLNGFQAVKYQFRKPLNFLNLDYNTPTLALKSSHKGDYDMQLQAKALIYPLLLCCYTQKNGTGVAPQEYIIPQMLLRWVMDQKVYSGIRYPSTQINHSNYDGSFYNLVIPPIEIKDFGHCPELKKKFLMSEVCSYTHHRTDIHYCFGAKYMTGTLINPIVRAIDVGGVQTIYSDSEFGKMEYFVNSQMPVNEIKF